MEVDRVVWMSARSLELPYLYYQHGASVAMCRILLFVFAVIVPCVAFADVPLKVAAFSVDATPPIGSPLAYNIMERKGTSLWLKGMVLVGAEKPVVIVAVDWIGIGGEGHTRFREAIAGAVGTTWERVALHCLHQHDAPRLDWGAEELLADYGLSGKMFNVGFARKTMNRAADAAKEALARVETVTHVGLGRAKVEKVASNRRILGADGKVQHVRWTATKDPKVRAFPEGTIDPHVKSISFYNNDKLLNVVTYYATHPQSYYRTGSAEADFPGMARILREDALGVPHIHFNGAGGNIGAGKYNDGSHDNRTRLAGRLARGMEKAFAATEKFPVTAESLGWDVVPVLLPLGDHLNEQDKLKILEDESASVSARIYAAKHLSLIRRTKAGATIDISCLTLGKARVLHMPGELFVEYQLKAATLRPDLFVAMAAYGEYSPGYIGTTVAYSRGGYETQARVSQTAPHVEAVLMGAVRKLLKVE